MDRVSLRQSVLAGNLANINTPGYKRRDVDFAIELEKPKTDPDLGARQLAKIWNEIKTGDLVKIADGFDDDELGLVMFYMQKSKVAEVLAKVTPARAAKLSKEIQRLASIVPADDD